MSDTIITANAVNESLHDRLWVVDLLPTGSKQNTANCRITASWIISKQGDDLFALLDDDIDWSCAQSNLRL